MKCIKAIKSNVNVDAGDVIRVTDSEAEKRVKSGYWMYVAKLEWKATKATKPKSTEEVETKSKKYGKKK
jgi:hypothetical protein